MFEKTAPSRSNLLIRRDGREERRFDQSDNLAEPRPIQPETISNSYGQKELEMFRIVYECVSRVNEMKTRFKVSYCYQI